MKERIPLHAEGIVLMTDLQTFELVMGGGREQLIYDIISEGRCRIAQAVFQLRGAVTAQQ